MNVGRDGDATYADTLRRTFPALDPVVADLFLLEAHEVDELPSRVHGPDLAAVLHAHPGLRRFLALRHPPVGPVLDALLAANRPQHGAGLARAEDAVVWEVADLIVYERAAEYYDARAEIPWDVAAVAEVVELDGAVVVDAGAGTGRVALDLAPLVRDVFAVEPVGNLRRYLRERAEERTLRNLHVVDGFLHSLPLPDESVDVLVTCHAVGWDLPRELLEIDRVLRPTGTAVHVFTGAPASDPLSDALVAAGHAHDRWVSDDGRVTHRYVRRRG